MTETDRTGTIIDGRFAVEQLIGRGGFSSVYRARQSFDGAIVAIKVLELNDDTPAASIERFTREAEFASKLTSANTIRIFETSQVGTEYLYSVMEYIAGRSLARQLNKFGGLNPRQVAEVAVQICNSLIEVHDRGLVHRDLKPSNIMLFRGEDGRVVVKVLDFGVAKVLAPTADYALKLTAAGTFVGTPRYASPEQMRREPLTTASDVYSLGLIMWESLMGEPAIPNPEFGACIKAHISREPWNLPLDRHFPSVFVTIIQKSLAKPVDRRYQSCTELKAALLEFLEHRKGSTRRSSGSLPAADSGESPSAKPAPEGDTGVE